MGGGTAGMGGFASLDCDDGDLQATEAFFPLDDPPEGCLTWPSEPTLGEPLLSGDHNFGFTTEVHYFFVYQGDEELSGDDDLWVFVDDNLCLDVGGLHPQETDTMSFANPSAAASATQDAIVANCKARLTEGHVYEVSIFHAERHETKSNFKLTLDGFVTERSTCDWTCGDGVATRFEFCDDGDGKNNGGYGECKSRGAVALAQGGAGVSLREHIGLNDNDREALLSLVPPAFDLLQGRLEKLLGMHPTPDLAGVVFNDRHCNFDEVET